MKSGVTRKVAKAWLHGCCLFLALVVSDSHARDTQATEQQLQQLKSSIKKLEHWLQDAKGQRTKALQELKKSEIEIGRISKKIFAVNKEIEQAQTTLQRLTQERQELNTARAKQEVYLASQIRAAYSIGRQEYLKVLLNQEQPEQLARAFRYYDYFNQARTKQISAYNQIIGKLEQNESDIQKEKLTLSHSREQLEFRSKTLQNSKAQRRSVLLRLEKTIKNKDEELAAMVANQKNLERLLGEVEKAIAELELPDSSAPINQLKGKLPWPTPGKIAYRFGMLDPASHMRWSGILIEAAEGDEVKAIHRGRVVFSDWLRGFGLLMILDHGNGYMSLYGHNQALYKDLGDWVDPNEVIARVGSSGGRAKSGLYFEFRHKGQPQNPQKWMLARG